jgi:hypothetical protein
MVTVDRDPYPTLEIWQNGMNMAFSEGPEGNGGLVPKAVNEKGTRFLDASCGG